MATCWLSCYGLLLWIHSYTASFGIVMTIITQIHADDSFLGLSLSRPAGITSFAGRPHSRTAPSRTEELEGSSERNASLCIVHWDAAIEFNCFLLVLVCVHACLGIHFLFHTTQRQHAGGAAGYGGSSPLIPLFRFSPRPPPSSWLPCSFHIHMRLVALLSLSLSLSTKL
jgi:hypothetical protein